MPIPRDCFIKVEGGAEVDLKITIPLEEYKALRNHSLMLGRIAGVVRRYARTPETTTYECVVALDARVKNLGNKIRRHKEAGGTFLK